MSDVLIRDFPDVLKEQLVRRAMRNGRNLSEEAVSLISSSLGQEDLPEQGREDNAYEAIRRVLVENDALSDDFAEIMEEVETERKRSFGRPVEGFD